MNREKARKRIFEILEKLSSGYDFNLTPENFSLNNEIIELVEILTKNNPYYHFEPVSTSYVKEIDGDPNALGTYYHNKQLIVYQLPHIIKVAKGNRNFMLLLDTIYHELAHHIQELYRSNPELIKDIEIKQITNELLDKELTYEDLQELHRFAHQHDLLSDFIKPKLSKRKLKNLQFGAYLSEKCEIDARNQAFECTNKTYQMMIDDPLCNEKVKKFLNLQHKHYCSYTKDANISRKMDMKSFDRLDRRVKSIVKKAVKSDKDIDDATYNALLDGILAYMTKSMTLEENLEIATWALKHNYRYLLGQINLRNSLSRQRDDYLSKFINDVVYQNLLTTENFSHVCDLFSSFGQKANDSAITYLVECLADLGSADILLSHADLGSSLTFQSQYISPQILNCAVSNYLGKIEQSKTIADYDKYTYIRDMIVSNRSSRFIKDEMRDALLPHMDRLKKIDSDTEIKIIQSQQNEQNQEITLSM